VKQKKKRSSEQASSDKPRKEKAQRKGSREEASVRADTKPNGDAKVAMLEASPEKAPRSTRKTRKKAPAARRELSKPEVAPLRAQAPVHVLAVEDDEGSLFEEAPELGLGSRMVPPHVSWSDPLDSTPPPSAPRGDVAEQIRALEARLDGLIRSGAGRPAEEAPSEPLQSSPVASAAPLQASSAPDEEELATSSYFEKQWGREGLRNRSEEVDDFGLDPAYESRFRPIAEFFYRRYFRVKTEGIANVPADGRAIVVANHSGTLPLDGAMLRTAFRLEHPSARELRWLAEDFLFYLPFAGVFMNRVGAVRACQENAERLLSKESVVAVFPEGVQGIRKLYRERYQLQRFGRGGYIRLALRQRAPIVPCAIVGAEETHPLLYRVEYLASVFGLPYIPVTPTFPLLGPLGLVPAPSRWRIQFGEPISLQNYGPEAAEDHVLVGQLSERVRTTIQSMLDNGVRQRRSVWFG
jgi:1-acyl-sn-glycerol-3-phosphate acyltransferase